VKNYYRTQGGLRPKPRPVVAHAVPGIAFDVCVVAIFLLLVLANLF
jgi:hypothetical protein